MVPGACVKSSFLFVKSSFAGVPMQLCYETFQRFRVDECVDHLAACVEALILVNAKQGSPGT